MMMAFGMVYPPSSIMSFHSPKIRAGLFQCVDHPIGSDEIRVVPDHIDFTEAAKSFGDGDHTFQPFQPFQGGLADVISSNVEGNLFRCLLSIVGNRGQRHCQHDQHGSEHFGWLHRIDSLISEDICPGTDEQIRDQTSTDDGPYQNDPRDQTAGFFHGYDDRSP